MPSLNGNIWVFSCPCGHEFNTVDDERKYNMLKRLHLKKCPMRGKVREGHAVHTNLYGSVNNDYAIAHA